MKNLHIFLLLSCVYITSVPVVSTGSTHTKACPYANEGLTWQKIAESDRLGFEYVRCGETDATWRIICTAMYQIANETANAGLDCDAENVVMLITRATASDEEWAEILQTTIDLCRKKLNAIGSQSEIRMIVYLNNSRNKGLADIIAPCTVE
jgi:hypothetical protein